MLHPESGGRASRPTSGVQPASRPASGLRRSRPASGLKPSGPTGFQDIDVIDEEAPSTSIPVAMGLDGPSVAMRRVRLPGSRPETSWSAPSLLSGMPGELGMCPLLTSGRAKTATSEPRTHISFRGDIQMQRKKVPLALGRPAKNPSVWQRWRVNVPSNRLQREEVLERDRERQRATWGGPDQRRSFASPARSHAASLFFASVPGGGEVTDFLPLGAMRRVARPQTRQMHQLPNLATGSATSSPVSRPRIASSNDPKLSSTPVPDDLQNEDFVFERHELEELTDVLDAYTSLTAGAEQASSTSAGGLGATAMALSDTHGLKKHASGDPYLLRPLFCRFLLASKMCGDETSVHNFQESLSDFDKYANNLGAYTGIPRSVMILLIAKMLRLKGNEGIDTTLYPEQLQYDPTAGKWVDTARPAYIRRFLKTSLVYARGHAESRKLRYERLWTMEKEMSRAEAHEVPENVLAEVSSGSIWPPLPPRSVKEPELPAWMSGVKRWQEELEQQNPVRMLAMRRYTETVLRGEVLASQLLEPEVLHFAARFQPLFREMFCAYSDWPAPVVLLEEAEMEDDPSATLEMLNLGHLSFTAFFRFCVDFGIFPKQASFEEIKQTYHDAENPIPLPEPSPATTPSVSDDLNSLPLPGQIVVRDASGHSNSTDQKPVPSFERRPSIGKLLTKPATPQLENRPPSAHLEKPPTREKPPSRGQTGQSAAAANLMKSKKAKEAVAIAESAAKAAAEAAVPKADLQFMEKPLSKMTDLELKTLTFFASIDEWLSERFVRFADIWNELSEVAKGQTCDSLNDIFSNPLQQSLGSSESANSMTDPSDAKTPAIPAEVLQLQQSILDGASMPPPPKQGQRRNSADEKQAKFAAAAAATAAAAVAAAMAVPPVTTINAKRLLRVIQPMGMANRPSVAELEEMYMLLCRRDDAKDASQQSLGARREPLGIAVFEMDKVLRAARRHFEDARISSSFLLRPDIERRAIEKDIRSFLTSLYTALLDRASFMGRLEDFLEGCDEVTPEKLLDIAENLGVDISLFRRDDPAYDKRFCVALCHQITPGSTQLVMKAKEVYRALALVQEGRRYQRREDLLKTLRCLAHSQRGGPHQNFFGLEAFAECLLKLSLHRLGGKGSNEIQRGSPSWWKCAWLIAVLSGEFSNHVKRHGHELQMEKLAHTAQTSTVERKSSPKGRTLSRMGTGELPNVISSDGLNLFGHRGSTDSGNSSKRRHTILACSAPSAAENAKETRVNMPVNATEMEAWWYRISEGNAPRYMPPAEHLVLTKPDLFDPATGETNIADGQFWPEPCSQCNESPAPSGWGSPGCPKCSGVEELCLPISKHPFSALLKIETPIDMPLKPGSEEISGSRAGSRRSSDSQLQL